MGLWCQGTALGQMERNTLVGPGFFDTDFGVKKSFKITESSAFRIEANFFNLFNKLNLYNPQTDIMNSHFGEVQNVLGSRVIEMQARFSF